MSHLLVEASFWTWATYITLICTVSLWLGGASERWAAGVIFCGWLASWVLAKTSPGGYGDGVAVVDVILLAVLVVIALRSSRYWPLWAAGFHLLAVMTHWAHLLDPSVGSWTYQTAGIIWGYLLVGALAFGTWGAWRERRQPAMSGGPMTDPGPTLR